MGQLRLARREVVEGDTVPWVAYIIKSEKTQKADELIAQATTLLEKGLQLTELETTMLELKDRLEEIIVQFEVANVGSSSEDVSS